jgi:hypothetical protein
VGTKENVMPKQKDLKRVVRARMQKTGESYTTARMQLVKPKIDYAAKAGMADATIKKQTGRDWAEWVRVLDAKGLTVHRDIAEHVHSIGVPDWWAQTVTVGYERIKGLRAIGQRRSGTWEANKSKTFSAPAETVFKAWTDTRKRKKWLPEKLKIRSATSPKSIRIAWPDGTTVAVWFQAKGAKTSAGVQHIGLKSKDDADRLKQFWSERLETLADIL